jgi:hypothetical protein
MHPMILIAHDYREKNRESSLLPFATGRRNRQAMVQRSFSV